MPARYLAYLAAPLGVLLATASLLAAGHPAIAAASGAGPSGHPVSAGSAVGHRVLGPMAWPGHGAPWQLAPGPVAPAVAGWPQSVPRPGSNSQLNGIYCTSVRNCWAVGNYEKSGALLNQVLHWNGKRWSLVAAAQPGGTRSEDFSELFGIRCLSADSCWAVGDYEKHHSELSEALHWNGKRWYAVATPSPAGTLASDFNDLFDVFCTSTSSCWAAGQYGAFSEASETFLNQALHWNGKRWSQVATPNPGGTGPDEVSTLAGIRCPKASDCWAVGTAGRVGVGTVLLDEALHWNGKRWSKMTIPSPGGLTPDSFSEIQSLACLSAKDCWATGAYGSVNSSSPVSLNEALHWNGKHWSKSAIPDPGGTGSGADNSLIAVTCFSSANCWTVGATEAHTGDAFLNEVLQWDGRKWVRHSTPDPGGLGSGGGSHLQGVRCPSRSGCWAVGVQEPSGKPEVNQLLRWNGSKWSTG